MQILYQSFGMTFRILRWKEAFVSNYNPRNYRKRITEDTACGVLKRFHHVDC